MSNQFNTGESAPSMLDAYRKRLASHDWFYDRSDDFSVWKRGAAEYSALCATRQVIDRSGEVWNSTAPKEFQVKPLPVRDYQA